MLLKYGGYSLVSRGRKNIVFQFTACTNSILAKNIFYNLINTILISNFVWFKTNNSLLWERMQNCQIRLMCKYNAIIRHVNARTSNFSVLIASATVTLNFVGKHKTTPIAWSSNFDGSKNVMVALEKRIFRTSVKWWEKRALDEQSCLTFLQK